MIVHAARFATVALALAGCGKKPTEAPMPDAVPAVSIVEEMCRTVVQRAGDVEALGEALNAGEPGAGGTRPVAPDGSFFASGHLVPMDQAVRSVELGLASPSPTLAAELEAAWGAPGSPPMMPGAPMKRLWTRDVDPGAGFVCTVAIALAPGETWEAGSVRQVMFRPDPRG